MIQTKTPKKIKGARKKRSAQRKVEAARTREFFNAEVFKAGETYYGKIRWRLLKRQSNFICIDYFVPSLI